MNPRLFFTPIRPVYFTICVAVCVVLYVICIVMAIVPWQEADRLWTTLLLCIPLLQILVVAAIGYLDIKQDQRTISFYPLVMVCCLTYLPLWLWYMFSPTSGWLYWPSIGCALTLVGIALWVTYCIIQALSANYQSTADVPFARHRFHMLCFFLLMFVCVAYLLSFALAFDDQGQRAKHKKWQKRIQSVEDKKEPDKREPDPVALDGGQVAIWTNSKSRMAGESEDQQTNPTRDGETDETYRFHFAEGYATLDMISFIDDTDHNRAELDDMPWKEPYEDLRKRISNLGLGKYIFPSLDRYTDEADPKQDKKQVLREMLERARNNNNVLKDFIQKIRGYPVDQRLCIILMGHSNDRRMQMDVGKSRYQSNYELSDARVRQVLWHLYRELRSDPSAARGMLDDQSDQGQWHNIEWLLTPISNEAIFVGEIPKAQDRKLCVEVSVMPIAGHMSERQLLYTRQSVEQTQPRPLTLLDYVYFTIYTITTTGYGDIKPITGHAKVVVCLANLLEVFFVVAFFNVLMFTRHH